MQRPAPASPPGARLEQLARLILDSHQRLLGRPLLAPEQVAEPGPEAALWQAPLAVVAHGVEADPVFCYGNRLALELFELDFAAFTALPSQRSAEPVARAERTRLLERVTRHGYITDYAGVRIASSGRRFRIEGATVWNLVDATGVYRGQAAAFAHWRFLDR